MTKTYSAYVIATGEITGKQITVEPDLLAMHPPPVGNAWIEGDIDYNGQRVELRPDDFGEAVVPVVVPYQPPAPADSQWQTWAWDATARRYVATPTQAALNRAAAEVIVAQLAELDAKLVRPAGEVTEALALGQSLPADAVAKLQEINTQKAALRQQLAALGASTSDTPPVTITTPAPTTEPSL